MVSIKAVFLLSLLVTSGPRTMDARRLNKIKQGLGIDKGVLADSTEQEAKAEEVAADKAAAEEAAEKAAAEKAAAENVAVEKVVADSTKEEAKEAAKAEEVAAGRADAGRVQTSAVESQPVVSGSPTPPATEYVNSTTGMNGSWDEYPFPSQDDKHTATDTQPGQKGAGERGKHAGARGHAQKSICGSGWVKRAKSTLTAVQGGGWNHDYRNHWSITDEGGAEVATSKRQNSTLRGKDSGLETFYQGQTDRGLYDFFFNAQRTEAVVTVGGIRAATVRPKMAQRGRESNVYTGEDLLKHNVHEDFSTPMSEYDEQSSVKTPFFTIREEESSWSGTPGKITFKDRSGRDVATVENGRSSSWLFRATKYTIEVEPGVDAALVLASVIIHDRFHEYEAAARAEEWRKEQAKKEQKENKRLAELWKKEQEAMKES